MQNVSDNNPKMTYDFKEFEKNSSDDESISSDGTEEDFNMSDGITKY